MTTTAGQRVPEPLTTGGGVTVWERWSGAIGADPRYARLFGWLLPTLITLLAAVLRIANLAHPHALVFDETYYVKDAWSLWNLGYSASWPDGADESFVAGDTDVFGSNGSFVVHPPLGKYLIALGMAAFGADSSFGWRVSTAVFGTLAVLVLYFVAKRMTGSSTFAGVAAFLMAIDGLAIVMSRVSLLDNFLMFFVLVAFWFVLLDRERTHARIAAAVALRGERVRWGPVLWNRPWIAAAGAALGAAAAVKWSGVYALAGLGLYLVVTDAFTRRRAGVEYWPADGLLRQGPVTFVLLVPIAATVYLASWTSWLLTGGGYGRDDDPNPLIALGRYHEAIYAFHVGLSSPHAYSSPAWQWPLLRRPTSMWVQAPEQGTSMCFGSDHCIAVVTGIPNPLIWYAAIAATLYIAYRWLRTRDWRLGFVLTGVAVTYVPWLLYPQRTTFFFYTVAMLPFLILALALALRAVAGVPDDSVYRRASGQGVVVAFLVVAALVSAFFYPTWTGMTVPYDFWHLHNWSPLWI